MTVSDLRHTPHPPPGAAGVETRAGYVTLAGRPNAGKSTLLNALVGEKLSIVTSKAQTTWRRVTGIHTEDGVQMIFLDSPGLLDARDLLQRSMLAAALEAVREADVLLLVLDATRAPEPAEQEGIREALAACPAPVIAAVNKIDAAEKADVEGWEGWARSELGARAHRISALRETGLDALRADLRAALPRGPFLYPEDEIASDPVRFFVAEMVRETVFEQFREEIPYSVWCRVEEFREAQDPIYIHVDIFVERDSQKQILIGKGGRAIRELGTAAREKIEPFLDAPVYLDLWVKTLPRWRRRRRELRRLGFSVPDDG
ncbi:MAG TPA: GTPase Era [Longimicrobiales bacterium]|nr:GTPase Era [Longimicrobiales bacterium]